MTRAELKKIVVGLPATLGLDHANLVTKLAGFDLLRVLYVPFV